MSEAKVRSIEGSSQPEKEAAPLRFVTAASLFDGHDASINIMRRILQSLGVEVIHLAKNNIRWNIDCGGSGYSYFRWQK